MLFLTTGDWSATGKIGSFIWNVEGGVLLSISLGLAVRTFWSDLEKFPKSASGKILEGSGRFGPGTPLGSTMGHEKLTFARERCCGEDLGESILPK